MSVVSPAISGIDGNRGVDMVLASDGQ